MSDDRRSKTHKRGVGATTHDRNAGRRRPAPSRPRPPADGPRRPLREDLVRAVVLEAYARIRDEGKVADRTLDALLRRESRLYAVERRAVADAVYAMLRLEARLEVLLAGALGPSYAALSPAARHALLYQAHRVLAGQVPPAKALAEGGLSQGLLPGLLACANATPGAAPAEPGTAAALALETALPAWLAGRFAADLGADAATALAHAMNERAPLTIRANRVKTDRDALLARLAAEGVAARPTPYAPDGLAVETRQNLFRLRSFQDGLFEIQDEGSQLLALLLDPHPGWLVVDACAGAGGKTLALAGPMKNRGRIVALDTDERRLGELPKRAKRAGVHDWESHLVPADAVPPALAARLGGRADAVLVDAPCSGTGVLRRNPDARFRLKPADVERFSLLQRELLARYAAFAKPGGRIVYATCSVLRAEDEDVVEAVLREHPELERLPPATTLGPELAAQLGAEEYLRLLPHRHGTDGFFAALLRRRA
jgi:16S rRNA (cytosine967-C5)-methyltransferase